MWLLTRTRRLVNKPLEPSLSALEALEQLELNLPQYIEPNRADRRKWAASFKQAGQTVADKESELVKRRAKSKQAKQSRKRNR